MADKRIRVFPRLREAVDAERLTNALLDLVDHLSNEDRKTFIAAGELVLKEVAKTRTPKGTAA